MIATSIQWLKTYAKDSAADLEFCSLIYQKFEIIKEQNQDSWNIAGTNQAS